MNKYLLSLFCCFLALSATTASAQEFEDPEDGSGEDTEISVTEAALYAFDTQADASCECDPEKIAAYEKCLKKLQKKALKAFTPGLKFNDESVRDAKALFADEADSLISYCQDSSEDDEEPGEDDGDGDFEE